MKRNNALILGVSSGFGKATALELAKLGYNIYGVHLDLGSAKKRAEEFCEELKSLGIKANFFNMNAADADNRKQVTDILRSDFDKSNSYLGVFLHSIAFGTLGPFIHQDPEKQINQKRLEMSLNVMANSMLFLDAGFVQC